jgi:hypothetical protein
METRRVLYSKKPKMSHEDRGVNDPRRISKIYEYSVCYDYFCNAFLPELEYCETEKQIDWVCDKIVADLFDEQIEDVLDLEVYYIETKGLSGCMDTLVWRCKEYSNEWKEIRYNTSSIFALYLCELEEDEE